MTPSRLFRVTDGDVHLERLTLSGGSAVNGGAIYGTTASPLMAKVRWGAPPLKKRRIE